MKRNLIAILRGITPTEILSVTEVLLSAGISKIEVPLNSPEAMRSIDMLLTTFHDQAELGAGTVLTAKEVDMLAAMGAHMVVSPNCNLTVIKRTKHHNMQSYPGIMTPSEGFAALSAGADGLKLFPSEIITPKGLKAIRAVLPKNATCYAVGGVGADNFADWIAAGANGFGVGSALYQVGMSMDTIRQNAEKIVAAFDRATAKDAS